MPVFTGTDNRIVLNQRNVKLNKNIKISHINIPGLKQADLLKLKLKIA